MLFEGQQRLPVFWRQLEARLPQLAQLQAGHRLARLLAQHFLRRPDRGAAAMEGLRVGEALVPEVGVVTAGAR